MERVPEQLFYELDTCGDITLILDERDNTQEDDEDFYVSCELPSYLKEIQIKENYPNTGFDLPAHSQKKTKKKKVSKTWLDPVPEPELEQIYTSAANDQLQVNDDLTAEDDLQISWDTAEPATEGGGFEDKCIKDTAASQAIQFRASSKHLMLASPFFTAMLKSTWAEGATLNNQGVVELSALGSTRESLLVFLSAIHCRSQDIPQAISVSQLYEIALLVDYYQSYNALQFYLNTWIESIKASRPTGLSRDSIKWLFISWVSKRGDIFTSMTQILQREAKAPLRVSNLPIPEKVIDRINESRETSIKALITGLYNIADHIEGGRMECSFKCDSMRLGALRKQMTSRGLLNPRPAAPYKGYSFNRLSNSLRQVGIPEWYEANTSYPHRCQIGPTISAMISDVESSIGRLRLSESLGNKYRRLPSGGNSKSNQGVYPPIA
ncbi:conserved hypothetical protein [Microsporum canis CBS 113480]|uniref:BTB domain-containing protein n=1 Tax=Arthroderma otae (strain ATCC MYA-4605 / CBS 113480) TaxID=554155 RepID=C5FZ19_ARTOC|nr:conserved hypothetical protein [Microsporum canis CBS 113480]EEQ34767.1 conserved hypothetical protein [Microsporum canis CBS 113480]